MSGEYNKPPKGKKKLKLEGTSSRKYGCPFRMRGYLRRRQKTSV
jgi:hypothetical protein